MEIQGFIKVIGNTETVGDKGFQKRDVVISTEEQYPQSILIQFQQGNCALLDGFVIGHRVAVSFSIQGKEWVNPQGETKYFVTLVGWRIYFI